MNRLLLKFLIAGTSNTFLSYAVFLLIFKFSSSAILALVMASIAGVTFSFTLNRYWVWKAGNRNSIFRFILVQVAFICINWLMLHLISFTHIPSEIAQFFIYILFAFMSYQLNKKYVFNLT